MDCLQFGGECNPQCQTYPCKTLRGYNRGRSDIIEELRPFTHTNIKGNIFIFIEDYNVDKLSFAEQLKENN